MLRLLLAALVALPVSALLWINPGVHPAWAALPPALTLAIVLPIERRERRRRNVHASATLAPGVRAFLEDHVAFHHRLDPDEQAEFHRRCAVFLREQRITGVGVELDDDIRAAVAASAVILTFGLRAPFWENLREILIYPERFDLDYTVDEDGELLGLMHDQGPLIFAADELVDGFALGEDGVNVGLHEFAHVLDFEGGGLDGVPMHLNPESARTWRRQIVDSVRAARNNPALFELLGDYAFTDQVEFFACMTESFFELPDLLHQAAPDLYDVMRDLYHQDPLARLTDEDRAALLHDDPIEDLPPDDRDGPPVSWDDDHDPFG
ncbi:MAG: hypothetical protein EA398_06490 [Deltaproteobacteria bacterium]|nr:MAG: hypothetical protein EA398_06490 [Deltaproteobacteria bacterium]